MNGSYVFFPNSDYVHTYQKSTYFDVGIGIGDFSLAIEYHKDIQEAYEEINYAGKAAGKIISPFWISA